MNFNYWKTEKGIQATGPFILWTARVEFPQQALYKEILPEVDDLFGLYPNRWGYSSIYFYDELEENVVPSHTIQYAYQDPQYCYWAELKMINPFKEKIGLFIAYLFGSKKFLSSNVGKGTRKKWLFRSQARAFCLKNMANGWFDMPNRRGWEAREEYLNATF